MADYYLIVGSGHSGSKWLAHVLNKPKQGCRCYHELKWKSALDIGGWPAISQHEAVNGVDAPAFKAYWKRIHADLKTFRYVGDSNAFGSCMVPKVHAVQPIAGIIYLVRNGIQVVHSIAIRSAVWRKAPLTSWAMGDKVKRYWELAGQPYKKDWAKWTRWDRTCLWWAVNVIMPEWLQSKLPRVPILRRRLEDLTTDVGALSLLLADFDLYVPMPKLWEIQKHDVNRKVKGRRTPRALWAKWSPKQRQAFQIICEPAMEMYGYRIPA